jgi:hypothetical protein
VIEKSGAEHIISEQSLKVGESHPSRLPNSIPLCEAVVARFNDGDKAQQCEQAQRGREEGDCR